MQQYWQGHSRVPRFHSAVVGVILCQSGFANPDEPPKALYEGLRGRSKSHNCERREAALDGRSHLFVEPKSPAKGPGHLRTLNR